MIKNSLQGKAVLRVIQVSFSDNDGKDLVCCRVDAGISRQCFAVQRTVVVDGGAV